MVAPVHGGGNKRSVVMTEAAVHTIGLPEGHFAAIVLSRPISEVAAICILGRDEVEAHITLLRNAMDDAERLDAGYAPKHATPSLRRN